MSNTFRTSTYVTGVPCSFCGAQPNHWCKNLNGTRRQIGPHRARVEAHRLAKLAEAGTQEENAMSNKFQEGHAFTISLQPVTVYEVTPNIVIGAVTGIDGDRFGATWDVNTGLYLGPESDAGLDYEAPALNLRPNVVLSSASEASVPSPPAMLVRNKWYVEAPEKSPQDSSSDCIGCAFYRDYSCTTASSQGAAVFGGDCAERGVIYVEVAR